MLNKQKSIEHDHNRLQYVIKLVISGDVYEWYEFEISPVVSRGKEREMKSKEERIKAYMEDENQSKNFNKTKKEIQRLINSNKQLNKFLTLTFNSDIRDLTIANPFFHKFVQRMRGVYTEFQYICIPEFQSKSKRVHYHLLCYLPYIPSEKIAEVWKYGFINIKRVDRVKNLAHYMTKYLTKDLFDERLFGKKKFFCSKELNRPVVYHDLDALEVIAQTKDLDLKYQNQFNAPFCGTMKYLLYEKKNSCKI